MVATRTTPHKQPSPSLPNSSPESSLDLTPDHPSTAPVNTTTYLTPPDADVFYPEDTKRINRLRAEMELQKRTNERFISDMLEIEERHARHKITLSIHDNRLKTMEDSNNEMRNEMEIINEHCLKIPTMETDIAHLASNPHSHHGSMWTTTDILDQSTYPLLKSTYKDHHFS